MPARRCGTTRPSGTPARFRAVRRNLSEGFIASHLPRDLREARAFLTGGDVLRVATIAFVTDAPGAYAPTIRVTWRRLAIDR